MNNVRTTYNRYTNPAMSATRTYNLVEHHRIIDNAEAPRQHSPPVGIARHVGNMTYIYTHAHGHMASARSGYKSFREDFGFVSGSKNPIHTRCELSLMNMHATNTTQQVPLAHLMKLKIA